MRAGSALPVSFLVLLALPACVHVPSPEDRKRAQAHVDLAVDHLANGRNPDAVRDLLEARSLAPGDRDTESNLGIAYRALGKWADAERHLRSAVEIDPKYSEAKNNLATVLIQVGRCEEARTLLEPVLEDIFYATPWYAEHNLALALECLGKVDDAVKQLRAAVLKNPSFCLGYLELSRLAERQAKDALALEACDGFLDRCEGSEKIRPLVAPEQAAVCLLRKGVVHLKHGETDKAREAFERCRLRSPKGRFGMECDRAVEKIP